MPFPHNSTGVDVSGPKRSLLPKGRYVFTVFDAQVHLASDAAVGADCLDLFIGTGVVLGHQRADGTAYHAFTAGLAYGVHQRCIAEGSYFHAVAAVGHIDSADAGDFLAGAYATGA